MQTNYVHQQSYLRYSASVFYLHFRSRTAAEPIYFLYILDLKPTRHRIYIAFIQEMHRFWCGSEADMRIIWYCPHLRSTFALFPMHLRHVSDVNATGRRNWVGNMSELGRIWSGSGAKEYLYNSISMLAGNVGLYPSLTYFLMFKIKKVIFYIFFRTTNDFS